MRIIITNNPMVRDKLQGKDIEFHETDCMGVFKATRDRIHQGFELLTHPLSGSVKPGETPYKTVIITGEKGALLDKSSLSLIEESLQTCAKLKASIVQMEWDKKTLADFQLIDYNIIFG